MRRFLNRSTSTGLGEDSSAAALSSDLLEESAAINAAYQTEGVGSAVARGFSWNFLNFAVSQVASTVFFLVLARELRPEVFGVFAMAVLVVEFVTNQGKSAAVDALLQKRVFDPGELSGFFYALLGICLTLFMLSWPLATYLSQAFHAPELRLVLPSLALTIVFSPAPGDHGSAGDEGSPIQNARPSEHGRHADRAAGWGSR